MLATVYDAGRRYARELDARNACLQSLVEDVADREVRLVLERDDSLLEWDRRTLYALARRSGAVDLRYEHLRAAIEPVLAVPDAIAWCWAKGGDWRRRIDPAVSEVREV